MVTSPRASPNHKLARKITTTGTARVGAGLWPVLFTANITPMTIKRNFQVVNSYQGNNIGQNVTSQLQQLTIQDMEQMMGRAQQNPQMLAIQTMAEPAFNQTRVVDNHSHLLSSNILLRLDNDWQLRANVSYLNHGHKQIGSQNLTYYLPAGELFLTETMQNNLKDHYIQGEFNLGRNAKNNYLDNKTKFETRWDYRNGAIASNQAQKGQDLRNPFTSFANNLRPVNAIGSRLVEFTSDINYGHSPHTLIAYPGGFEQAISQDAEIDSLRQNLDMKKLSVQHTASFSFVWKNITFTPRVGHSFRKNLLENDLRVFDGTSWSNPGANFSNSLEATHHEAFAETGLKYRCGQSTIRGHLPIAWQKMDMLDRSHDAGQSLARLTISPGAGFSYQFKGFWHLHGSYCYRQNVGSHDSVYSGYLLRSINSLTRNGAPWSQTTSHTASLLVQYRNSIIGFFNNANMA